MIVKQYLFSLIFICFCSVFITCQEGKQSSIANENEPNGQNRVKLINEKIDLNEKEAKSPINDKSLEEKLNRDSLPEKKRKNKMIYGVKEQGHFRIFNKIVGAGEGYYSGDPRVEILDEEGKTKKVLNLLDNIGLFNEEQITFEFNRNQGENYFNVISNTPRIAEEVINPNLFTRPSFVPVILMHFSCEVQHDLVLCKYVYYALEPEGLELFGSKSEFVIWDSEGNELARTIVEGNINAITITEDLKLLYISTGGQINEDALHPYECQIFDLEKNKIIFSRRANNLECIGCGALQNLGFMMLRETCSKSFQVTDLFVFNHQLDQVFKPNEQQCPKYSQVKIFDQYFECYLKDGKKTTNKYKEDLEVYQSFNEFIKN